MTYQVLVNGKRTTVIRPSRGLQQGDSLSPYLIILVADVLSRMMENQVVEGRIEGIKLKSKCPSFHHMFFADDTLFFMSGTVEKARRLRHVIDQYCRHSDQKVTFSKSSMFINASADKDFKQEIT